MLAKRLILQHTFDMSEVVRPKPYIGVSGIARYEQHIALYDIAKRENVALLGHFVMVGVQATGKTQVLEIGNKYGQMWHPVGDSIADASTTDETGLTKPYVHCFFSGEDELSQGIINVMRRTRHYVRGLQFNGLPWVSQDYRPLLTNFRENYPDQSIILQAGSRTLDYHSPQEVAKELGTMPVDYVLFDPSGGQGKAMDSRQIRAYVDEIYQRQIPVGVAISGGLEAQNVQELFGPLAAEYHGLSCDAEGRLRKGPNGATELDISAAEAFISAWKDTIQNSNSGLEN